MKIIAVATAGKAGEKGFRVHMAKSKYEYVKSKFELEDEDKLFYPKLIVVRLFAHDFPRFSEVHGFGKLIDEKASGLVNSNAEKGLNLMNACATATLDNFSDIVFAYGFGHEYSFVFKKDTKFHKRRSSKILSIIVSFFTSVYVTKWKEFFPQELSLAPCFHSRITPCASMEVLQAYLAWRQGDCHTENQDNTCLRTILECGRIKSEDAQSILKGTQEQEKNELLFKKSEINYTNGIPCMFRQGSCLLKTEVDHILKYNDTGSPIKRMRKEITLLHPENIAAKHFWNAHHILQKELGSFEQDMNKSKPEYLDSFQVDNRLMPSPWIIVRIDGCNFHSFSEEHDFVKPNDEAALKLMNSCAVAVLKEFPDIVFAYGVSDEYSFVLKKECQLHQRRASEIVSVIVSLFSSIYVLNWKEFFPKKHLMDTPHFDGRAVCYPSSEILRDYISWRQVDCHINNQYNTCFWMLVKSGKTKSEAQKYLKGTQAQEKNKLLLEEFDIDYNALPIMFRQGSSVFWDKGKQMVTYRDDEPSENSRGEIVVEHCNVIESSFWEAHPSILDETREHTLRVHMAQSKYEYVKSFELEQLEDEVMYPDIIVVRLFAHDFPRFTEVHGFGKLIDGKASGLVNSNAEKALNLMNSCATATLDNFSEIVFAYGFGHEYSFVFKKDTKFHKRRSSKILSIIVSFFTSVYVTKWKEFFPQELSLAPYFHSRITPCASMEVLQAYLAWRQGDCHTENQYNTCLWMLMECGRIKREEAQHILKGTQKQEKNELLFKKFGINYTKDIPCMFRQGSFLLKTEVDHILKYNDTETPIKRMRNETALLHSKNIAAKRFWNDHNILQKELGSFEQDVNKTKPEYLESFQVDKRLMPSTWIVVRIDGCNFQSFSEEHDFVKPNDEAALKLMNSCAVAMLKEFPDIVFAYGVSDEYSFVLKKECQLHERRASEIVSVIVSLFSSMYVLKWKEFFPTKQLKDTPHFDGQAVYYTSSEILQDYIAWRQVDCHINNQYNTCFWMLVKSGKTKSEAQKYLKGTQALEKNRLLLEEFDIVYNALPVMFREGSSVFWDKERQMVTYRDEEPLENLRGEIVVEHCNVIESSFWEAHPSILDE